MKTEIQHARALIKALDMVQAENEKHAFNNTN
jgi:hypothetical protein